MEADAAFEAEPQPSPCRVLIVSAAMGGGHMQISRELERRLSARGHAVTTTDLNQLMPGPTGRWLEALYPWLVNRAPALYELIYQNFFRARQRTGERARIPVLLALPGLRRLVERLRPHVVVSTYHLSALAVARLRQQGELDCPALTFITTFSVHNLWTHPGADLNVCISEAAAREATKRSGRPSEVCGPIVRPEFEAPGTSPGTVRRELGVAPGARIALVVAGSLGMGSVERAVRAIGSRDDWVPVVVCGRNAELRRRIEQLGCGIALGWVDDMAGLMAASDVLVENAGGLSSKEALVAGLPVVSFQPLAGHGRDDTDALAALGLTRIVPDERGLHAALERVTGEPERRQLITRGRALVTGDPTDIIERAASRHSVGAYRP